ncbi:unnamed protein product [Camellia sinensis]
MISPSKSTALLSQSLSHSFSVCVCVCEWKLGSSPSSSRRKFYLHHKQLPPKEMKEEKENVLTVLPIGLEAVDCSTKTQPSQALFSANQSEAVTMYCNFF